MGEEMTLSTALTIIAFCSVVSGLIGFGIASTMAAGAYNKGYDKVRKELND